jgi:hypothetical protein
MNRHRHSRCQYKRNSGSTPAGMNNLHIGEPAGRQTPGDSSTTSNNSSKTKATRALPIRGLGRWKGAMQKGSAKAWLPSKGVALFLKATLPTCVLSRCRLNLHQHAPRSSPYDTGAGSHASCKLAQDRRSQTAARGARNCPAVTSTPSSSPKPAGERADRHTGGMRLHQGDAPFRLRRVQHGGPGTHVM